MNRDEEISPNDHIPPFPLTPTQCWKAFTKLHFNQFRHTPSDPKTHTHSENEPWGDTISQKEPNRLRLYFLNINGLSLDKDGGKLREILAACDVLDVDLLGLAEHNCDTLQYQVRRILLETHKKIFAASKSIFSTSQIKSKHHFKPGGTSLSILGNSTGRVIQQHQDDFGRWTAFTIVGKPNNITILSVYQVTNQHVGNAGPHTAFSQQLSMILQRAKPGETTLLPRQQFIRDLDLFLAAHIESNEEIIMMGDYNESILDSRNGIKGIIMKYGLVDVMQFRHPDLPSPNTYSRGSRRLDYRVFVVVVTQNIVIVEVTHRY